MGVTLIGGWARRRSFVALLLRITAKNGLGDAVDDQEKRIVGCTGEIKPPPLRRSGEGWSNSNYAIWVELWAAASTSGAMGMTIQATR